MFSIIFVVEELLDDEDDDDDVIIFIKMRFSEDFLLDFEFKEDDVWSLDFLGFGFFRFKILFFGNFGN